MLPAEKNSYSSLIGPAITLLLVVLIDQITKMWAVSTLQLQQSVEVLGRFLMFTLVYNKGGAMGTNFGSTSYYLISAILILGFVLYYLIANRGLNRITYPLALIAGGAIGNVIDRIRFGQVVDFIDVDFFDINLFGYHLDRWWTWNVADAAISCSIVFLIFSLMMQRHHETEPPAAATGPASDQPG